MVIWHMVYTYLYIFKTINNYYKKIIKQTNLELLTIITSATKFISTGESSAGRGPCRGLKLSYMSSSMPKHIKQPPGLLQAGGGGRVTPHPNKIIVSVSI